MRARLRCAADAPPTGGLGDATPWPAPRRDAATRAARPHCHRTYGRHWRHHVRVEDATIIQRFARSGRALSVSARVCHAARCASRGFARGSSPRCSRPVRRGCRAVGACATRGRRRQAPPRPSRVSSRHARAHWRGCRVSSGGLSRDLSRVPAAGRRSSSWIPPQGWSARAACNPPEESQAAPPVNVTHEPERPWSQSNDRCIGSGTWQPA